MTTTNIYFSVVGIFKFILRSVGLQLKSIVLIDCTETFHYLHIGSVVNLLARDAKVKIFLLENKQFNRESVPDSLVDKSLFVTPQQAKFIKFDMTISLEYTGGAWVPHKGIQVFTPHGDGMKMSYAADKRLRKFDLVWALSDGQERVQASCLRQGATIEKIGFIATDQLTEGISFSRKPEQRPYDNGLPTILYAPSWSNSTEMVLMSEKILEQLATQTGFNVFVKPHPLLLRPDKCEGKDWKKIIQNFEHAGFTLVYKPSDFIYQYMMMSDVLVSDISSVIFEYLFLDRPIVVHVNETVLKYYEGGKKFNQAAEVAHVFSEEGQLIPTIQKAIKHPNVLSSKRQDVLNGLYYNVGQASEAAVKSIYHHFEL